MATFTLTEITPTGGTYAQATWRLVNGTTQSTYMTQAQFDAWGAIGEPPTKPAVDATFLMAAGNIPAFNTPNGRPRLGDFWVRNPTTREVVLYFSDEPNWGYSLAVANDPLSGQTSQLQGFACGVINNTFVTTLTNPRLTALRAGTLTVTIRNIVIVNNSVTIPDNYIQRISQAITATIPNHRSVTFDASSHAFNSSTNTLTWSHTVASQSDRYLSVGGITRQRNISSPTYNGDAMTTSVTQATSGDTKCEMFGLVAPDTGTNTVSLTQNLSAGEFAASAISAYGVDQATPTTDTDSATGASTGPTLTLSSAASEIAFTVVGWDRLTSVTNTPDGTWTAVTADLGSALACQGAYKTGAASVTRTDTLSASADWLIQGVAMKASSAPAGNTSSFFGLF